MDNISQAFHHFCEAWDCVKERVHCSIYPSRTRSSFTVALSLFFRCTLINDSNIELWTVLPPSSPLDPLTHLPHYRDPILWASPFEEGARTPGNVIRWEKMNWSGNSWTKSNSNSSQQGTANQAKRKSAVKEKRRKAEQPAFFLPNFSRIMFVIGPLLPASQPIL